MFGINFKLLILMLQCRYYLLENDTIERIYLGPLLKFTYIYINHYDKYENSLVQCLIESIDLSLSPNT